MRKSGNYPEIPKSSRLSDDRRYGGPNGGWLEQFPPSRRAPDPQAKPPFGNVTSRIVLEAGFTGALILGGTPLIRLRRTASHFDDCPSP